MRSEENFTNYKTEIYQDRLRAKHIIYTALCNPGSGRNYHQAYFTDEQT